MHSLKFFQTVRNEATFSDRFGRIINAAVRGTIAQYSLSSLLSEDRSKIMSSIQATVQNEEKKFVLKESKNPFSMTDKDGLKSPGEIYEKRWNKELVKGGIIKTMSDQFLGTHNVDTEGYC